MEVAWGVNSVVEPSMSEALDSTLSNTTLELSL